MAYRRCSIIMVGAVVCLGLSVTVRAQDKPAALEEFAKGADTTVVPAEKPSKEKEGAKEAAKPELKPPAKAAAETPADLGKMLSSAEDQYKNGRYKAAETESDALYKRIEELSRPDQERLLQLMDRTDKALKDREAELLRKYQAAIDEAQGPVGQEDEAQRVLEAYKRERDIKKQMLHMEALDHLKAGNAAMYNERDFEKARAHFRQALIAEPGLEEARRALNICDFLETGKDKNDVLLVDGATDRARAERDYNLAQLRNRIALGDRYYEEAKYQDALAEYRKAQTLVAFLELRTDMKEQRQALETKITQTETAYEAWQAKAKEQQLEEAKREMEKSLESLSKEERAKRAEQFDRVVELMRNKDYDQAERIVLEMLYQDRSDRAARILLQNISRERYKFVMRDLKDERERELLRIIEQGQERFIPYSELVKFPDRRTWREVIDVRAPVGYPSRKVVRTKAEEQVYAQLEQPVEIDFTDTPLPDVLAFFREVRSVNIVLDKASLPEDLAPVTMKMKDVPLQTALKEILEPLNMAYAVEGNVIKVARKDKLEKYELRVYDVRDLLLNFEDKTSSNRSLSLADTTTGGDSGDDDDDDDDDDSSEDIRGRAQSLARLISQVVRPETWRRVGVIGGPTGDDDDDSGGGGEEEFTLGEEPAAGMGEGEPGAGAGRGRIILRGGNPGDMVILQTPEVHSEVEELLKALRTAMTIQVEIDARFITVTDSWLKDIGFNIDTFQNSSDDFSVTPPSTDPVQTGDVSFYSPSVGTPATVIMPDGRVGLGLGDPRAVPFMGTGTSPNPTEPYGMNVHFSIFDQFSMSGFFKALQSATESETLSSPRVTLANAQRGYLTVGTQTNYVASFSAEGDIATPEIETVDDSISLDVRPVVSADRKYVYLELAPYVRTVVAIQTFEFAQTSTSGGTDGGATVPVTTRVQLPIQGVQEVETTVMVPDRGILTIGGLSTMSEVQVQNGVPVLNKIPILKRLFSNDRQTRSRRNLLILVRPRILIMDEARAEQL